MFIRTLLAIIQQTFKSLQLATLQVFSILCSGDNQYASKSMTEHKPLGRRTTSNQPHQLPWNRPNTSDQLPWNKSNTPNQLPWNRPNTLHQSPWNKPNIPQLPWNMLNTPHQLRWNRPNTVHPNTPHHLPWNNYAHLSLSKKNIKYDQDLFTKAYK